MKFHKIVILFRRDQQKVEGHRYKDVYKNRMKTWPMPSHTIHAVGRMLVKSLLIEFVHKIG